MSLGQGRTVLLVLTVLFIITEVIFHYILFTLGDGDLYGAVVTVLFFLVAILLFSKRINWAKWALSVLLALNGLVCFLVGLELGIVFHLIGLFDVFFAVYIHVSRPLAIFRSNDAAGKSLDLDPIQGSGGAPKHQHAYPSLVKRLKALFIDGSLLMTTLIIIMYVVDDSDMRTGIMVSSGVLILFTYEPLLTVYSRTVGQKLMGIRVGKHENPDERINLTNAYLRWLVKGLLGWISFLTIHANPEKRAVHDIASDSVMVAHK